jgi:hypothetical protein
MFGKDNRQIKMGPGRNWRRLSSKWFAILNCKTGNGPEAMAHRECGSQRKRYWKNKLEQGKLASLHPDSQNTQQAETLLVLLSLMTVFVMVNARQTFKRISKINRNFKTCEVANLLFFCMVVKLGFLLAVVYLSRMFWFSKCITTTLREIHDLQQVYFKIKLYLICEPKNEKEMGDWRTLHNILLLVVCCGTEF